MENITLVKDVGMNMNFCHICDEQSEKLVKIKTTVPNVINTDLTIEYKITIFMCGKCLNIAHDHINKKEEKLK